MLAVTAPAKVNLFLHLAGKRADGYHLLETLAVFPQIGDALYFTPGDVLTLQVEGEFAAASGSGEDNLVLRAARLLNHEAGTHHGAHIRLVKNIPVGAGLGGGSADAAATLKALNRFWGLEIPFARLTQMAATLGADVPMCMHSVPLYAHGIGEQITLADRDAQPLWMVLTHPNIVLSTATVFAAVTPDQHEGAALENHLYPAANALAPVVGEVIDALRVTTSGGAALKVAMSGSGACCYALFADEQAAQACVEQMQKRHPQWWSRMAQVTVAA